ncbi:alpha/beta hydrolase [Thalassolituus sp.]|jgi:pimeloyl-ACP methyl ester carboxylesterase|uniref:alpha/beta hydrolase n=1 Tax=Thalassolituus sp. TaxID=2030822 RepID=UPI003519B64C
MSFKQGMKSTFRSEGADCAATIYYPDNKAERTPAILMIHGWGGIQLVLFKDFIRRFNEAGYAVMTFDYPGWGASSGLPRNRINPWERVRVSDSALTHLKSQNEIDENRIVVWGTSFGGGHAIDLAAEHPEIAGVIAHVPMLNGMAAVAAVPFLRMLRFSLDITLDLINPFKRRYIPVVSPEGEYSTMDRDGAGRLEDWVNEELEGKYDNRVTAASLLTMAPYQPGRNLHRIQVPGLIVGALRDTVAPFNEASVRSKVGSNISISTIDANHFDPYLQPWFEDNVTNQLAFLKQVIG